MEELDTLPPQRRKLRGRTVDTEKHLKGCHVTRGRCHTCAGQQTKNGGGELKRGNFNVAQRNFFYQIEMPHWKMGGLLKWLNDHLLRMLLKGFFSG